MDCSEAKQQLPALASGRLATEDEAELRRHLESCEECTLELELLQGPGAPPPPLAEPMPEPVLQVAPLAPPTSDWTVEKIFGDDRGGIVKSVAAEESARSASNSAPPPLFSNDELSGPAAEPEPAFAVPAEPVGAAPTMTKPTAVPEGWDFEPADAAREATPPEESLLFAEQVLNRRLDDPNKKSAAFRAMLWGGGAVVGVGLLGVAVWMVLAPHAAPPREISTRVRPFEAGSLTVTHSAPGADGSSGPGNGAAPESVPGPAGEATGSNTDRPSVASSSTPPTSVTNPVKSSLTPPRASPSVPTTRIAVKPSVTKPTPSPATATTKSGAKSTGGTDVKSVAGTVTTKDPFVAEKSTATAPVTPAPRVKRDDDDMWPTDDPIRATPVAPKAAVPAKRTPNTSTPESSVSTPPAASTPERVNPPSPDAPPAELRPIDRIHAATVQAAKDHDLVTLRQLKVAWKNLLRTVVGPDRSRAKRELADCLWEIQGLSGRDAEQRETLAAYRDFLLNAPAGGADARSAARLRELEDALAERR